MKPKRNPKRRPAPRPKMGAAETVICYVATLILAGCIAHSGLDSPAVWGFLGVAIGLLFGKGSI